MNKFEGEARVTKAKWEAPELVGLDMDLGSVKNAFLSGTDGLGFGLSSSMS